ncbi:hypothetical protein PIB30_004065 [Stylosanthes scabra]|uniref:Ribonuclease H1 N-terminal domain-containing protein n=1 Tax=Stylosanthes scabra TaxID=79078 RepID=A0ABU6Y0W5_9FABA|nr:hypothetical protein [Stylosanthes scabra]
MEVGRFTHYAVRVGRVPGIYYTWPEAEEQPGGGHWVHECGKGKKKQPMSSQRVDRLTPHMQNLGVGSSQQNLTQSQLLGSVFSIPGGGREADYVPETQRGGFVIMEEMELYMLCVCMKMGFGCPNFEPRLISSTYGGAMFSFKAAIRCDEKGINVEVEGGICGDQARAREDAAYNLLDNLLSQTGYSILDFNFRKVCALRQRIEELEQQQAENTDVRVVELESGCAALKTEIETYQKHLGFSAGC